MHLTHILKHLTHLALLATLGVLALLPAFDHHAAEYNPWHSHLLPNGSVAADLPWHHDHPYAQPHTHPSAGASAGAPTTGLVFAPNPLTGMVSALLALDQVLPPLAWLAVLPLAALWLRCIPAGLLPRSKPIPILDPPPRLALP